MPMASRDVQVQTISRNVLKYARDRELRLMFPRCQRVTTKPSARRSARESAHFSFADGTRNKGYELTDSGRHALTLLDEKRHTELRRLMVSVHLETYTNLHAVVHNHIACGGDPQPGS